MKFVFGQTGKTNSRDLSYVNIKQIITHDSEKPSKSAKYACFNKTPMFSNENRGYVLEEVVVGLPWWPSG